MTPGRLCLLTGCGDSSDADVCRGVGLRGEVAGKSVSTSSPGGRGNGAKVVRSKPFIEETVAARRSMRIPRGSRRRQFDCLTRYSSG